MAKYFVVWGINGLGVVQSEVTTSADPHTLTAQDWMLLAAGSEDMEVDDDETWDMFCVIDYPTTFYQ